MTTELPRTDVSALADGFRGTDPGNALRLVAIADGKIRWVREWGAWIVYTDGVWRLDVKNVLVGGWAKRTTEAMFQYATDPARTLSSEQRDLMLAWAKRSEARERRNAMIDAARDEAGVLIEHTELDQHHDLLNVLNGTINLRTGELLDHNPDHLITHQLQVSYNRSAGYGDLWMACLEQWQPDPAMRRYLQEKAGSYATGYCVEEFDVNLGTGGNGKGKFYGQLVHVLGDYAVEPHESLIVATKYPQHETVIANLFGARLVLAGETEQTDRLNEAKIKSLTGGDQLSARRMNEDRWKFWPTHSMVMHTNYKPLIRGTDTGIWRRIKLILWPFTITEDKEDKTLAARLRARREVEGTLNWMVDGAIIWLAQKQKFTVPETVRTASTEYRASTDTCSRFLDFATDSSPDGFLLIEDGYDALMGWRNTLPEDEERPPFVTKVDFGKYLQRLGHEPVKRWVPDLQKQARGYVGIALKPWMKPWLADMRRSYPDLLKSTLNDLRPVN